jgi:ribose 5-phosphate isomerase B
MKIAIGLDHAGFKYKEIIKTSLIEQGYEVKDFGTHSEASCNYPDFIRPVAEANQMCAVLGLALGETVQRT